MSAFANAGGGDLIFGINEDDDGIATEIVPMDLNPDETALRLADLLMNGVEPRMPGVQDNRKRRLSFQFGPADVPRRKSESNTTRHTRLSRVIERN
ncbi:helix-turn-helix domain-containing protein [Caballeronia sp. 15715]|uniref:AlbA family DNA-binding domain-containing protein n=1 Tax=Caballeronia sp. 15715 TaxID=3391030 RepID=UPI0039E22257